MQQALATFKHKVTFISDVHMGSDKSASAYLYEYLMHLDYDVLEEVYIVGDFVGGWERQGGKQKPLPEMERRCIDCLNYAASRGIKINFLPGNHDEKLRPILDNLNKRKKLGVFGKSVSFMNEAYYRTEGDDPKTFKVIHGDQHDPEAFVKPLIVPFVHAISAAYDMLVILNFRYSRFMYQTFGIHSSFAPYIKSFFKRVVGYVFSHQSLLQGLREKSFDGEIFGHIHTPGIRVFDEKGRKTYLINTGDWVENATASVVTDRAQIPTVMDYKIERERVGFGALPQIDDPHPHHFALMRPQTDRQVRLMHRLWPARNRQRQFKKLSSAALELASYKKDKAALVTIMHRLDEKKSFDETGRAALANILVRTKREAYGGQKKGIAAIFKKYASAEVLAEADLLFMRTVVREFTTRADRKIRKNTEEIEAISKRLDFLRVTKQPLVATMGAPDTQRSLFDNNGGPAKLRVV